MRRIQARAKENGAWNQQTLKYIYTYGKIVNACLDMSNVGLLPLFFRVIPVLYYHLTLREIYSFS